MKNEKKKKEEEEEEEKKIDQRELKQSDSQSVSLLASF